MTRTSKLKISQPRFDAGGLPDPLSGDKRCLQINREWIPMIIGCLDWMNGKYAWLGTEPEKELAVQYVVALMEHLATGVLSGCEGEVPVTECCTEYPAKAGFVHFAPNDPFQTPHLTPSGYITPPWKRVGTLGQYVPGAEVDDALLTFAGFPYNLLQLPAIISGVGLPRFSVNFVGGGTIELHFLKVPLGGYAIVQVDDNLIPAKLLELSTFEFEELTALITTGAFGTLTNLIQSVADEIVEIEVFGSGPHKIEVIFLPIPYVLGGSFGFAGFGGGIRKVVLCGNATPVEDAMPQFRLQDCNLEWRPNDDTEWETLGNPLSGLSASVETLAAGESATVEISDCEIVFGIPTGPQGEQGEQGPQGEQGEQGEPGEDVSCEGYFAQPDHLDYFCRGSYVAAKTLVHEIYEKLSVYGDFTDPVGELFVSVLPLSMRDLTTYHSLGIALTEGGWANEDTDFLNLHYQDNYPAPSAGESDIQCMLFNYFYTDPTLQSFEDFGATVSGEDIMSPFREAMENPGNSTFIQAKLTEFWFLCIARLFSHWHNPLRTAIYYESNLSCPDSVMDCSGCIPPATWCQEFDFTTDDHGFLPGFENERAVWNSGFGWQAAPVDTDVIAIKYNFADEITLTQVTIFIDLPLEGNQNHWYAAFGEYNSENVFATDDTATEKTNTTPGHLTGSGDFLIYVDKNAGNNSGVYAGSITKVRFEGTGENPFGESNC